MEEKPRIFIASSTENIAYAHAVHRFLNNNYAETKLWETAVKPSEFTLPSLIKCFNDYDYGIFIFSDDDILNIRNKNYTNVRDNVLFEFGVFIGKHSQNNAFILSPKEYLDTGRIASDLFGITITTFDSKRIENDFIDTISSGCLSILSKINTLQTNKTTTLENHNSTICIHEANMYSELVELISHAKENIIITITSNERFIAFDLFISFLFARLHDVEIDIHYYPLVNKDTNSYSIEILKQLGCNTKEYPIGESPNFVNFIADPLNEDYCRMVVKTERSNRKPVYAYSYKGSIHYHAIKTIFSTIPTLNNQQNYYRPTLQKVSDDIIIKAFLNVPLYSQYNCIISRESVSVSDTLPQSDNLVREFKMKQISTLNKIYIQNKFALYEPISVLLKNGETHFIIPPVVEVHENKLLVAEGHTRLYIHRKSREKIICIKVEGISLPLPSAPTNWKNIKLAPDSLFKLITTNEDDVQRTRKIERYTHKADWFKK